MSDYISRQAAKDCTEYSRLTSAGIAPDRYADGWNDACVYIRDKLEEENPADVEPVRRWIPCSERLPDICIVNGELVNYLAYMPMYGVDIAAYHPEWGEVVLRSATSYCHPLDAAAGVAGGRRYGE